MPLNIEQAVLKTIIYADIFNFPLTTEETCKWLIGLKMNQEEINKSIKILVKNKRIELKNNYVFLPGRSDLIILRSKKQSWSKKKLSILEQIIPLLRKIPFIQMVGITGTLSMENADENDDIDLLIVTKVERLWLVRAIITLLLELKGIRRHPLQVKAKDKICINMFLDNKHLALLPSERDTFSAHELLQMRPIIEREAIYGRLIIGNRWVKKYLPNAFGQIDINRHKKELNKKVLINQSTETITEPFINCFELILKWLQMWYMSSKRTNEVINSGYIRFHPYDARKKVLSEYRQRLELFGLTS
jgi:D-beta-D-heptose 7-phosphate kinase/D-beta-D-heptose 1-phosphate adenosyltransferase